MRKPSSHGWILGIVMLVGCASNAASDDDGVRGDLGKADVFGSCAASDCGGKASDGNCFCDATCLGHGDCCSDKPTVCPGGTIFATYNLGLIDGAVPFANERVEPLIAELQQSPADVMCLQEVWSDEDAQRIQDGVAGAFPHAFREVTNTDSAAWFACGPTQWPALYRMNSCVSDQCTPNGISAFECAADQCAPQWADLNDGCKLCLAANTDSVAKCAAWKAPLYANEGRNGLMLLSRSPLENASFTVFDTYVVKRGVLRADVNGFQVQCTHMTADLGVVPYPAGAQFASWREEHAAEVRQLSTQAGSRRRTVLMGDLNTGPASAGVDAELPENFSAATNAGYRDTWTSGQACTYCQDNPLACSKPRGCGGGLSSRIDHIMLKHLDADVTPELERIFDRQISIVDSENRTHDGRLSDHYGVMATMPY